MNAATARAAAAYTDSAPCVSVYLRAVLGHAIGRARRVIAALLSRTAGAAS